MATECAMCETFRSQINDLRKKEDVAKRGFASDLSDMLVDEFARERLEHKQSWQNHVEADSPSCARDLAQMYIWSR